MQNDRILLVDDEQAVLDGFCRQHRKHYSLVPACGSDEGLRAIQTRGPFSVVVTDFQMPGLNGAQFLAEARKLAPDMIPIMLTGQADLQTVIEAVNRGQIFRFLTKPCEPDVLRTCIDAALDQVRLKSVERDLLQQTLRGSIEVLAEVMALSNPTAFGKATRIRFLVRHMAQDLKLPDAWQYETAALLSQIGYVAVPDDLLARADKGEKLEPEQAAMLERHPELARDLLLKIPRLEAVAEIVSRQNDPTAGTTDETVLLGSRMLAAALDFEELVRHGASRRQALQKLDDAKSKYSEPVLRSLWSLKTRSGAEVLHVLAIRELRVGMIFHEDVSNTGGTLIVRRGHEVTVGSLQRLRNYAKLGHLEKDLFRVHVPPPEDNRASSAA